MCENVSPLSLRMTSSNISRSMGAWQLAFSTWIVRQYAAIKCCFTSVPMTASDTQTFLDLQLELSTYAGSRLIKLILFRCLTRGVVDKSRSQINESIRWSARWGLVSLSSRLVPVPWNPSILVVSSANIPVPHRIPRYKLWIQGDPSNRTRRLLQFQLKSGLGLGLKKLQKPCRAVAKAYLTNIGDVLYAHQETKPEIMNSHHFPSKNQESLSNRVIANRYLIIRVWNPPRLEGI